MSVLIGELSQLSLNFFFGKTRLLSCTMQVDLEVVDSALLVVQQKIYLVVYKLELPGHLLVHIIDLVH